MAVRPSRYVIAVVDDDQSILSSLEYLLESADYAVLAFNSAAAFLASDRSQVIDCMISDIDMPGMDGFELLERVHSARPGLPTILITGYPERLQRPPRFVGVRPRAFTKPFHAEELLAAVADALRDPL